MTRTLYMPWPEQAALIRERYRQPITFQGETFTPSSVAAEQLDIKPLRLQVMARADMSCDVIVTLANGVRFVRLPLHRGNQRPPLYWDMQSLRGVFD